MPRSCAFPARECPSGPGKHLRIERENACAPAHGCSWASISPSGGSTTIRRLDDIDLGHHGGDERDQHGAAPVIAPDLEEIAGAVIRYRRHHAEQVAILAINRQPDHVAEIDLVLARGGSRSRAT